MFVLEFNLLEIFKEKYKNIFTFKININLKLFQFICI